MSNFLKIIILNFIVFTGCKRGSKVSIMPEVKTTTYTKSKCDKESDNLYVSRRLVIKTSYSFREYVEIYNDAGCSVKSFDLEYRGSWREENKNLITFVRSCHKLIDTEVMTTSGMVPGKLLGGCDRFKQSYGVLYAEDSGKWVSEEGGNFRFMSDHLKKTKELSPNLKEVSKEKEDS